MGAATKYLANIGCNYELFSNKSAGNTTSHSAAGQVGDCFLSNTTKVLQQGQRKAFVWWHGAAANPPLFTARQACLCNYNIATKVLINTRND